MRLHRLEVRNFRGIDARTLEFPDAGVVVVEGPNESGKSSLFEALHLVLDRSATSRAGDVRHVQPLGRDVGPLVSVELSLGPYRFRLTKQWLREPQATLDLLAPPPGRQLAGEEAQQWLDGVFGEHLDRPLWEALRVAQGTSLVPASPGGSGSLLRALDRAAGAAGGSEDDDLRAAVRREREAVFTPRTGRPTGVLREAEERRDQAIAERERLEEDVRAVEAQLEEAERLGAALVRLRGWIGSQREELDRLGPSLERLRALETDLETRRGELRLVTAEEQAALLELEQRRRLVDEAAEDERRVLELQDELALLDRRREELAARLGDAMAQERDAMATLEVAERRLASTREREARERDRTELEELRRQEERLERLLATRAEAAALLGGGRIGEDELARLVELERAATIAGAQAERSATSVRLRPEVDLLVQPLGEAVSGANAGNDVVGSVDAGGGPGGSVDEERAGESVGGPETDVRARAARGAPETEERGEALAVGSVREWRVEERLAFRLPGVAELEVVVGAEASEQALAAARAMSALSSACAALGVETVDAARRRVAAEAQASADLEKWDLAVATLLGGRAVAELAERRLFLEGRLRDMGEAVSAAEPDSPAELDSPAEPDPASEAAPAANLAPDVAALAEAVERLRGQVSVAATHSHELGTVHADLAATHRERAKAAEDAGQRRQASAATLARVRESIGDEELEARLGAARTRRDQLALVVAAAEAELGAADSTGLRLQGDNLRRALEDADQQEVGLEGQLRDLRLRLELQGEAGLAESLERARSEEAWATERAEACRLDAEALELLFRTLERHRSAARARVRAPFLHKLEELGRVVFGPSFAVSLDEELRVATRTLDGTTVGWDDLSGGAKEQLNLLLRLSAALLVDPGDGVPLLVDDALGYADEERLRRVGAVVGLAGRHCQVIVLTCVPERYRGVGGARWIRLDPVPSARGGGEPGPFPSVSDEENERESGLTSPAPGPTVPASGPSAAAGPTVPASGPTKPTQGPAGGCEERPGPARPAEDGQSLAPTKVIRAWAVAHGIHVGSRGRLPPWVLDEWAKAQRGRSGPSPAD
jgi:hypothetical protein